MTHRPLRQAAYLAVPALVLGALVAAPAPAQAADPDLLPARAGASYLVGQLRDGLMVNNQFDFVDYGLSIDTALALNEVRSLDPANGAYDRPIQAIADAVAGGLASYTTYPVAEGKTHVTAGALAKALRLAQVAGRDGTSYGGQDLVDQLGDRVTTSGPAAGRIADVFFPEEPFEDDFANTIGQGFAAQSLNAAGSALAAPTTGYLLAQQCDAGFFRGQLPASDATDQDCAGDTGVEPDTDTTALTLLALADLQERPGVAAATTEALDWLESVQASDGSFSGAPPTDEANSNSTGLAGWALGEYGRTAPATAAAVWVRARQAGDPSGCGSFVSDAGNDYGAVAYTAEALATARRSGIKIETEDQFRRAAAQATPALAYAPAGAAPSVTMPDQGFRRANAGAVVEATGLAPSQTVCVAGSGKGAVRTATPDGTVRSVVRLPNGTRTATYTVSSGANKEFTVGKARFRVLGKATPQLTYKQRPKRGTSQRVVVAGLVADESVVVRSAGRVVARGTVNDAGRYVARFKVGSKLGKKGLTVTGEFGNRRASQSFVVVKGR